MVKTTISLRFSDVPSSSWTAGEVVNLWSFSPSEETLSALETLSFFSWQKATLASCLEGDDQLRLGILKWNGIKFTLDKDGLRLSVFGIILPMGADCSLPLVGHLRSWLSLRWSIRCLATGRPVHCEESVLIHATSKLLDLLCYVRQPPRLGSQICCWFSLVRSLQGISFPLMHPAISW